MCLHLGSESTSVVSLLGVDFLAHSGLHVFVETVGLLDTCCIRPCRSWMEEAGGVLEEQLLEEQLGGVTQGYVWKETL